MALNCPESSRNPFFRQETTSENPIETSSESAFMSLLGYFSMIFMSLLMTLLALFEAFLDIYRPQWPLLRHRFSRFLSTFDVFQKTSRNGSISGLGLFGKFPRNPRLSQRGKWTRFKQFSELCQKLSISSWKLVSEVATESARCQEKSQKPT